MRRDTTLLPILLVVNYLLTSAVFAGGWKEVPDGNHLIATHTLNSLASLADNDVWAVGSINNGRKWTVLVEHWDGATWSLVAAPSPSQQSDLLGITSLATDNVWTVGSTGGGHRMTLVEHWDGSAWNIIPSPNVVGDKVESWLTSISAVSADDIWSVGYWFGPVSQNENRTLILHWDGVQWTIVPTPDVGDDTLTSVVAIGSDDVWAVGYTEISTSELRTLTLHWNGTEWSIIPSPNSETGGGSSLRGVTALASDNVWAVGYSGYLGAGADPYVLRWDGSNWTDVSPLPTGGSDDFTSVVAVTPHKVMAVGRHNSNPLTELWTGDEWVVVPVPGVTPDAYLSSVTRTASGTLWATGTQDFDHASLFLRNAVRQDPVAAK